MKTLVAMIAFLSGITAQAGTVNDFELQARLETLYSSRIKQVYPELRFSLAVNLTPVPKMELDLFDEAPMVDGDSIPVTKRIKGIELTSESQIDTQIIAQVLNLPVESIHFSKLPEVKNEAAQANTSFFKIISNYIGKPEGFMQGMQLILFALMMVAGVFALNIFRKSMSSMSQNIRSASENSNSEARVQDVAPRASAPEFGASAATRSGHAYTDDQLRAMFAECYWTAHDGEASALIRAYPKMDAYLSLPFGREYVEHLKNVIPHSLDFMNDAYYLHPEPAFNELSVEDTPLDALTLASQFRFESKNADPSALIQLQVRNQGRPQIEFKKSAPRVLEKAVRVQFRTVDEENAILKDAGIEDEFKFKLPSLFKLSKLDSSDFDEIISKHSLHELARGWVGPEWLLNDLEQKMSERKRALFNEIKPKVKASRQSSVFQSLIADAGQKKNASSVASLFTDREEKQAA